MIILDSNAMSELMRPVSSPNVGAWFYQQDRSDLYTTAISLAELLAGIEALPDGARKQSLSQKLQAVLSADFAGRVLGFNSSSAQAVAELTARRRRAGRPISATDAMIAAIAATHGATLATRDRDFTGCGIPVVNPWSAG